MTLQRRGQRDPAVGGKVNVARMRSGLALDLCQLELEGFADAEETQSLASRQELYQMIFCVVHEAIQTATCIPLSQGSSLCGAALKSASMDEAVWV